MLDERLSIPKLWSTTEVPVFIWTRDAAVVEVMVPVDRETITTPPLRVESPSITTIHASPFVVKMVTSLESRLSVFW